MSLEYFQEIDLHFQLLAGVPTYIEGASDIYSPSLKEIAQLKLSTFNYYLSILLISKEDYGDAVPDAWSNFNILCSHAYHDEQFRQDLHEALKLFFRKESNFIAEEENVYIQLGDDHSSQINEFNFPQLQEFLTFANRISKEPEYNPGNSKARELLEKIMKNKSKSPVKKESPMDIISIANALGWKENGVSIHEVFTLNSYQVYEGFFATNKIDDYKNTITGVYSGSIDGSKIRFEKIHWANKPKQ